MKVLIRRNYLFTGLFVLIFLGTSCVTQKRKADRSAIGKLYQNTTSKYNGYFNARELMATSALSLETEYQDNYNQLLPLYVELANDNPQALAEDMDKAIEKVTRVVALHPQSVWSDDCYLLVGQAQYKKQDFESAEKSLRYLVNNFDPIDIAKEEAESKKRRADKKKKKTTSKKKKKKSAKKRRREYLKAKKARQKGKTPKSQKEDLAKAKKEEKEAQAKVEKSLEEPDNYGLKHRPAYQEGQLWLARTLIERDNYDAALRFLNQVLQNPKLYDDVEPQAHKVMAYYYIYRKDFGSATEPLRKAIETTKRNRDKARLGFVLAQLYELNNDGAKAYAAYEEVLKYTPGYEMEFNCRLNMAQNAWKANRGTADQAIAELERLLKDEKNLDYKDQIYFAMAQVAMEEGDKVQAIEFFKESLRFNSGNKIQKSESYLALASLYFKDELYVQAKNYYDSTASIMSKNDERYAEVNKLAENLEDIAKYILIIEEQDSLIQLSYLSEDELKAYAFNKYKTEQEARRAEAVAASTPAATAGITPTRIAGPALKAESEFFAYDDRNVKRGQREFLRKWGNRTLGDNWRLGALQRGAATIAAAEEVSSEEQVQVSAADALTEEQLEDLLEGIPKTESDRRKAELSIIDAMFTLGTLFRDRLQNNPKAIESLEDLDERFPKNSFELESWYYLYLAHRDDNNIPKSNEYRNRILNTYTSSKYARVLRDPEYAAKLASEEYAINTYYDKAYASFTSGDYKTANQMANDAKIKFGNDNPLQARFDLLGAMTLGKLEGEQAYKNSLSQVIAKHADTEEQIKAREILRILSGASARLPGAEKQTTASFKKDDKQVHFVIVAFNDNVNLNDAKVALSDYNKKFHKLQRLTISNVFLGSDPASRIPMLIVRRFKDSAEALKYHDSATKNKGDFMIAGEDYDVFAISLNNYREVLRSKSVENYKAFFDESYLQD